MRAVLVVLLVFLLGACASAPERRGGYYKDDGPGGGPHPNLDAIADATPRAEPLNRFANRPYQALGKEYVPLGSARAFRQRGMASWYGRRFHGQKTASGETYDMYAMTAAHTTLPIPSYARVTNLGNGRSVVVRVNDRGPFHSDRIIDLSYAAAYKLGFLERGSAQVEVEGVVPGESRQPAATVEPALATPPPPQASVQQSDAAIFLQVGAFASRENADRLRERMVDQFAWPKDSVQLMLTGDLWRLHVGPYRSRDEARSIAERIESLLDLKPLVVVR